MHLEVGYYLNYRGKPHLITGITTVSITTIASQDRAS